MQCSADFLSVGSRKEQHMIFVALLSIMVYFPAVQGVCLGPDVIPHHLLQTHEKVMSCHALAKMKRKLVVAMQFSL